jgi:hypothetical protein
VLQSKYLSSWDWCVRLGLCEEAGGDDVVAAAFEDYFGQRLWWWAVENCAVGGGIDAAVAGAGEDVFFGAVEDRAGVMRTEAAEGQVGFRGGAEEEAGAVVGGIGENFGAADGNFVRLRDYFYGVRRFVFLPIGYQRACHGQDAGDAEPYVEAAAGDGGGCFSFEPVVICFANIWLPQLLGAQALAASLRQPKSASKIARSYP